MFRSVGNMVIRCYLPVFFSKIYPNYSTQYSIISAISLLLFGMSSVLLGGYVGQKYEKKYTRTNAFICLFGVLAAIPLITAGTLIQGNFWLSMLAFSLTIFVSGSYFSPAITLMQNSVSKSNSGNVVSVYTFVTTIAQTVAPIIFGFAANYLNV